KFEEKSERDQILLLSETQTIRKLMLIQEGRKSPLQMALEWLGIVKPAPSGSMMIELASPAGEKNEQASAKVQSKSPRASRRAGPCTDSPGALVRNRSHRKQLQLAK